jgi:SEC-C motif-containing protein
VGKRSRRRKATPGRNDPCWCGSGEKYKRCCGLQNVNPPERVGRLTREECGRIAGSLDKSLAYFGISLNPTADLASMIRELKWIASFPAEPHEPGGAAQGGGTRAHRAFYFADQAGRIAEALDAVRNVHGAAKKVVWLKKRLDRLQTQSERAQDYLFEIEVAGRLARHPNVTVAFEEPDLMATVRGMGRLSLACKRPHTSKGVANCLDDGRKQIVRGATPGALVVSLEALIHSKKDGKGKTVLWDASSGADLRDAGFRLMEAERTKAALSVYRVQEEPRMLGILWWGLITGRARDNRAYAREWLCYPEGNARVAGSQAKLRVLAKLFRDAPS